MATAEYESVSVEESGVSARSTHRVAMAVSALSCAVSVVAIVFVVSSIGYN